MRLGEVMDFEPLDVGKLKMASRLETLGMLLVRRGYGNNMSSKIGLGSCAGSLPADPIRIRTTIALSLSLLLNKGTQGIAPHRGHRIC